MWKNIDVVTRTNRIKSWWEILRLLKKKRPRKLGPYSKERENYFQGKQTNPKQDGSRPQESVITNENEFSSFKQNHLYWGMIYILENIQVEDF